MIYITLINYVNTKNIELNYRLNKNEINIR